MVEKEAPANAWQQSNVWLHRNLCEVGKVWEREELENQEGATTEEEEAAMAAHRAAGSLKARKAKGQLAEPGLKQTAP